MAWAMFLPSVLDPAVTARFPSRSAAVNISLADAVLPSVNISNGVSRSGRGCLLRYTRFAAGEYTQQGGILRQPHSGDIQGGGERASGVAL